MRLQKILVTIGNVSDLVEDLVDRLDGVDTQVRAGLRKLRRRVAKAEADLSDANGWFESADLRFENHDRRLLALAGQLADQTEQSTRFVTAEEMFDNLDRRLLALEAMSLPAETPPGIIPE